MSRLGAERLQQVRHQAPGRGSVVRQRGDQTTVGQQGHDEVGRVEVGPQRARRLGSADQGREVALGPFPSLRVSRRAVRKGRDERGGEAALLPLEFADRLEQPLEAPPGSGSASASVSARAQVCIWCANAARTSASRVGKRR